MKFIRSLFRVNMNFARNLHGDVRNSKESYEELKRSSKDH